MNNRFEMKVRITCNATDIKINENKHLGKYPRANVFNLIILTDQ